MPRYIDPNQWNRKEIFHFFKAFEEPFFGITVNVECTSAYLASKKHGSSFFLSYLHKAILAANQTEPFRYRIRGEQILVHEVIHASATLNRDDGTFGFSWIHFDPTLEQFILNAKKEIERVKSSDKLFPKEEGDQAIFFSSLPWLKFTALSHARKHGINDCVPKISFGKIFQENEKWFMPLSVHVHHALVDGKDVAAFVSLFEKYLKGKSGGFIS